MCVIAGAPLGVARPSDKIMEQMFTNNPDGAGFAYTLDDKVYVEKGFMSYKEFDNALAGLEKRLRNNDLTSTDIPMFFHFRIGTHGANVPSLTHPFPISTNTKNLFALDYSTDVVMAHNGIINSINVTGAHSDTTEYVSRILVPLRNADTEFYKNPHFQELMQNTIDGSRFIFLTDTGEMETIGSWLTSEEAPGVLFSNLNHEWTWSYTSPKYGRGLLTERYDNYSQFSDIATVKQIPKGLALTADDNIQQVINGTEHYPAGLYLVDTLLQETVDDSPYNFYIEKKTEALIIDLDKDKQLGDYLYDLGVVYRLVDEITGRIEIIGYEDIDSPVDTIEVIY